MVVHIGQKRRAHLYITEHREARGLTLDDVANRVGVARNTIWRWENEQHRLAPEKITALAVALDIDERDFYRPPSRPSLDAIAKDMSDESAVDRRRYRSAPGYRPEITHEAAMRLKSPPPGAWGAVAALPFGIRAVGAFLDGYPLAGFLWAYGAVAALITISWFVSGLLNKPR